MKTQEESLTAYKQKATHTLRMGCFYCINNDEYLEKKTPEWYNGSAKQALREKGDCMKIHIGMRKIKSLIALGVAFIIWQLIRMSLPMLEAHPVFAYIYAVLEIRETPEKTKKFGKLRIKATFIGLVVGLVFITLSVFLSSKMNGEIGQLLIEVLLILIATLVSLVVSEITKCENFCGIAAIIAIICMVSQNEKNIYLYAVMRVIQTLIGILSAMMINLFVNKRGKE